MQPWQHAAPHGQTASAWLLDAPLRLGNVSGQHRKEKKKKTGVFGRKEILRQAFGDVPVVTLGLQAGVKTVLNRCVGDVMQKHMIKAVRREIFMDIFRTAAAGATCITRILD